MDKREKILFGSEGTINQNIQDLYVALELKKTGRELKSQEYQNNFDVKAEFDKERNTSRNFRVYGIVDSVTADCDNIKINVFQDSGFTKFITLINSTSLNLDESTIFNTKRGKYLLSLNAYTASSSVFMVISGDNVNYTNQVFERQLVYYDNSGIFIPYGSNTIDIDNNGNTTQINNDFPFLYNLHWMTQGLSLTSITPTNISFSQSQTSLFGNGSASVQIALERPSVFGNESIDLIFNSQISSANLPDFSISINENPANQTNQTLSFSAGEQFKTLTINSAQNFLTGFAKSAVYDLQNSQNVFLGPQVQCEFDIEGTFVRSYANFNIGPVFGNRLYYTGRTLNYLTNSYESSPSILRNGLLYSKRSNEFFPMDSFYINVLNKGNETIIPANSGLGNNNDIILQTGVSMSFKVSQSFSSSTLNTFQLYIPNSLQTNVGEETTINGFNLTPNYTFQTAYDAIKNSINEGIYDIYKYIGIEKPFKVLSFNDTATTITIQSLSNGVPLVIGTNFFGSNNLQITATETIPFIYSDPEPISFTLLANDDADKTANYDFIFRKPGYSSFSVLGTSSFTNQNVPTQNYLVTSYQNMLVPYNQNTNFCLLPTIQPDDTFNANTYLYPQLDAYMHGIAMLGLVYAPYALIVQNQTVYGASNPNSSYSNFGNYGKFINFPFVPITCTSSFLSVKNTDQSGALLIPPIYPNLSIDQHRGFSIFTGSSIPTTIYTSGQFNYIDNAFLWSGGYGPLLTASAITQTRYATNLPWSLDVGHAGPPSISPIGISVVSPGPDPAHINNPSYVNQNVFLLTSKTPGVPFTVNNFIVPSTIPGNSPINYLAISYVPIYVAEIAGVTRNQFANGMGGFSLTPPAN